MTRYNVLLVGVGGQGLLTLGAVIGAAAIEKGVDVTIAETHGMSQRGGSLVVHVRLGKGASPLIPKGAANLIVGMEALETARNIVFANRETLVIMNNFLWPPPLSKYPSLADLINEIRKRAKLYIVDAMEMAKEETGLVVTANTLVLGYALAIDKELQKYIDIEAVERGMEKIFHGRALELNKKVLWRGYREGEKVVSK